MDLFEYQAKDVFAKHGVPVLPGAVASTPEEARKGAEDIVVFGGGIVPEADIVELERLGVAKVFTPGATTQSIVDWVTANVAAPTAG